MNTAAEKTREQVLRLDYVLQELQRDGIISGQQVAQLEARTRDEDRDAHPLITVAEQGWQSNTTPPYPVTLEQLTRWLAKKSGQEYLRIDPLKIDVNKVTGVVSQGYASKLKILPVKVTDTTLTIATCEPYVTHWEQELARISKHEIKRVIMNPRDIDRYLVEFYGVSRSIRGAESDSKKASLSALQNFEQLIEVGKAGNPTPTTATSSAWWTGCCSLPLNNGPVTFISNPVVRKDGCDSASTESCTWCTSFPLCSWGPSPAV
jgi:general secretion pathway protein E